MPRILTMMVVLALAVAACGGDSDDSPAVDSNGKPSQTQPSVPGNNSTPEGSGASTATLTLDGETYNFSSEGAGVAQCLTDLFGVYSVQLPMVDDGDGFFGLIILRDGTDPAVIEEVNAVDVSIGDEDWFANEADDWFDMSDKLQPGMSQVDSAEIVGRTVRGTATFAREYSLYNGEPETATGTFEATCGEERTV